MPSSIIRGKYLLCKANDRDVVELIEDGAVLQRNGEIIDVGKYSSVASEHAADEVIGSDRHIVLPGLVNAHQHGKGVSFVLMGTVDDGFEFWEPRLMKRRPVDPYFDTMYCIARSIESGVTTVMHSHPPRSRQSDQTYEEEVMSTLRAYADGGIRVAFALGIRDKYSFVYPDNQEFLDSLPSPLADRSRGYLAGIMPSEDDYFALFEKLHREYEADPKVSILHGPSALHWCSDKLLARVKQSADEHRAGIHTHMLETPYQKLYGLTKFGKTFPQHLSEIGFFGPRVSLAHCGWVTEDDIELLARSGASVCHNPSSNLRLKNGIAPINRMLERGVNVALGTDNLALNDDDDIIQDLRLCANLHRISGMGRPSPTSGQLLKMVTTNGAKTTLFGNEIGALEKGKRADIILIDLQNILEPYCDAGTSIADVLWTRAKSTDVDTVMINGEIVFRERKHTRINKEKIVAGLRESLARGLNKGDLERMKLTDELSPYIRKYWQGRLDKEGARF